MDLENLSDDQLAELLTAKYTELQSAEAKVYRALFPDFRRELLAAQKAGHVYGDPEARAVWKRARLAWQELTGLPALVDLTDWKRAALKVGYNPATFASAGWLSIVEWLVAWAENLTPDNQTIGPLPGNRFCWDGKVYDDMGTIPWRLLSSMWGQDVRTVDDVEHETWGDFPPNDIGPSLHRVNKTLKKASYPKRLERKGDAIRWGDWPTD